MADSLEWRQRLESTHKQLLDAMTELITNKNYSEAERILYVVDKLMLDLIEDISAVVVDGTGYGLNRNGSTIDSRLATSQVKSPKLREGPDRGEPRTGYQETLRQLRR